MKMVFQVTITFKKDDLTLEFTLRGKNGAYPCIITIDPDNGRYTIRKEDTSGEVFNSPEELKQWIHENWTAEDFEDPRSFQHMLDKIQESP